MPAMVIADTSGIEETYLQESNPAGNYGGWTQWINGVGNAPIVGNRFHGLFRVVASAIPQGDITGAVLTLRRIAAAGSVNSGTLSFHNCLNEWIEGFRIGSAINPQPTWNEREYAGSNWAGHPTLGCGVSGTDFTATPEFTYAYGPYTAGGGQDEVITVPPQSLVDIRDGTNLNGWLVKEATEGSAQTLFNVHSSEAATAGDQPSLVITYNETTISGTSGLEDTYLEENVPTWNQGTHLNPNFGVPQVGGSITRCLTRVADPSDIPAGDLTNITLNLYRLTTPTLSVIGGDADFHFMLRDWGEGARSNAAAQTDESSWNVYAEPNAWQTGGGDGALDRDAAEMSIAYPSDLGSNQWVTFDMTPVADWFSDWRDGVRDNNGWMIRANDESDSIKNRFYYVATEHATLGQYLTITYNAVTIEGTGSIDDAALTSSADLNGGGSTAVQAGRYGADGVERRTVFRYDSSLIPHNAVITDHRLQLWRWSDATQANSNTLDIYVVKDANSDWVEGTGVFDTTDGCDWFHAEHNTANAWAGSDGLSTLGVDTEATPLLSYSYGAFTSGADYQIDFDLTVQLAEQWRDGARDSNAGILFREQSAVNSGWILFRDSHYSTNTPKVVISYYVPTNTVLIGAADIEDNYLIEGSTANFGADVSLVAGTSASPGNKWHTIFRFDETLIPAGDITSCNINIYRVPNSQSTAAFTCDVHAIKNGNNWGEGDNTGTDPDAGESSYDVSAEPAAWLGGANGCGISGVDFDATPEGSLSLGAYTSGPDVLMTYSLTSAVVEAWRDATRINNGVLFKGNLEGGVGNAGKNWVGRSSESASKTPFVTVTYNAVTIGGPDDPSAFDVAYMNHGGASGNNYGGFNSVSVGRFGANLYRGLIRYDKTDIPDGDITGHSLRLWQRSSIISALAGTLNFYAIKDGNNWVGGNNSATPADTGECAWDYTAKPTAWIGSAGCGTAGVDYDSVAVGTLSFPAYTSGGDVERFIDLDINLAVAWRDGSRVNNGLLLKEDDEVDTQAFSFDSEEAGSDHPPKVVITYTPVVVTGHKFFFFGLNGM